MSGPGASASYDVFISYSSADLALAENLHRRLVAEGFSVWFDKARLEPGFNWHAEIEAGCESSRVVLPVLTPRWKGSDWTKFETYGAGAVIPLHYEGMWSDVVTPPLARYQNLAIDLHDPGAADWPRLFASIRRVLDEPPPQKDERLAHLRYRANPYFVGREAELNRIHEALHQSPTAELTQGQVRAIAALGGVGKTTLARHYAEKFWRLYPQLLWVDARGDIVSGFSSLLDALRPGLAITDANERAALALRILNERTERLLILDDCPDEESIQDWIPKTGGCRTLITSRFAGWSAAIETIHLYVLEPTPARELLLSRAARESTEANVVAADRLAEKLGYLPLALEQAAAYVREQGPGFTFDDYLRLYAEAAAELLAQGVLGSTQYPDSVITTWKATIVRLGPPARAILRLAAFLAPEPIPVEMFVRGADIVRAQAARFGGGELPAESSADVPAQSELWVRAALADLCRYSMATQQAAGPVVHGLVQVVERLEAERAEGLEPIERALSLAAHFSPGKGNDARTWLVWSRLGPHATALLEHPGAAACAPNDFSRISDELGLYFVARALYLRGEPPLRRALATREASLGSDHPDVAASLASLALLLDHTNHVSEAESLHRRALAICQASLGPDHPNVATSLDNLACLLHATNRLSDAEPLHRRALAIRQTSLGPDHPAVAASLNNLAMLLQTTNRLSDAEPLFRRALAIHEGHAPDQPEVAASLESLSGLLRDTNRFSDAEPLQRRALAIRERSLGPDHPDLAKSLNNLASLLQHTHRLPDAEPLFRRALAIHEASLGPDHPDVATCLNNLAVLLKDMNRLSDAEPLHRRALAIRQTSLGPNHPDVASSLINLAALLQDTNRLYDAEPLFRRALAIHEASFGPDHPTVATSLAYMALLLQATNRLSEAELAFRRALAIYQASLGADHPHVAACLNNLAMLLQATNRLSDAEPLFRRALAIREANQGPSHPDVATSLDNLAVLLQHTHRLSDAESLHRRALAITEDRLGPGHADVARILNNLASLLQATGRLSDAEPLFRRALEIAERNVGRDHRNVATILSGLASLLDTKGNHRQAQAFLRRVLAIREAADPVDTTAMGSACNNLGSSLVRTDDLAEAENLLTRSANLRDHYPNPHYWLARLYRARASEGDPEREATAWRRYIEIGPTNVDRRREAEARLAQLAGLPTES